MPTIGLLRCLPPIEPKNPASPWANTPPSAATIQYPNPVGEAAMPTIGEFSLMAPSEPWYTASPKVKMPPSPAASQ